MIIATITNKFKIYHCNTVFMKPYCAVSTISNCFDANRFTYT